VFQQVAAAGCGPSLLNGFDKALVVFEHAIHSFFDQRGRISADTGGEVLETSFLIR